MSAVSGFVAKSRRAMRPVSCAPSSNRVCGFPAHGFRSSFAPRAFAWAQRPGFGQAVQPQRAVKRARGIVRVSRPALLAPAHQPLPQALFDKVIQPSHDALRAAEPEVVLPAAQHCSICSIVIPSGPAAPRFAATRPQATSRNHGLLTLSYN